MFPAGYSWEAVWANVQSMMALSVVLGTIIVMLSLWLTPLLVRALMGLTGVNRVLQPWESADDRRDDRDDWEAHRPRWRVEYRDTDDDWRD